MYKIIILISFFGIISCSREEHFNKFKPNRDISFSGAGTGAYDVTNKTYFDTIKLTSSNQWTKTITFLSTEGLSIIKLLSNTGTQLSSQLIEANKLIYQIGTAIPSVGNQDFKLEIVEVTGLSTIIGIKVFAFQNWNPIAKLEYDSPNKKLDFSKSIDQDNRFGGRIVEYKIFVNNVLRKQDNINYFATTSTNGFTPGTTYQIKLEVIDNDGASNAVENTITIN